MVSHRKQWKPNHEKRLGHLCASFTSFLKQPLLVPLLFPVRGPVYLTRKFFFSCHILFVYCLPWCYSVSFMRAVASLVFFSALSLVPRQCVLNSRYSIKHICRMKTDELDQHGEVLRGSVMGQIVCVSQKWCVEVLTCGTSEWDLTW